MRKEIKMWFYNGFEPLSGKEIIRSLDPDHPLAQLEPKSLFHRIRIMEYLLDAYLTMPDPQLLKYVRGTYTQVDLPADLREDFKRKGKLYNEAHRLHAEMCHTRKPEVRAMQRQRIIDIFNEMTQIWLKCDLYIIEARGKKADRTLPKIKDPINLVDAIKQKDMVAVMLKACKGMKVEQLLKNYRTQLNDYIKN